MPLMEMTRFPLKDGASVWREGSSSQPFRDPGRRLGPAFLCKSPTARLPAVPAGPGTDY